MINLMYKTKCSRKRSLSRSALFSAVLGALIFAAPPADAAGRDGFQSHQRYISALQSQSSMNIDDPASVLKYVLSQSADVIKVQPTENYSYFKFAHEGLHWQGNMRLETEAGNADKLHFAYFVVPAPWHDEELGQYKAFGKADGLSVEKVKDHAYRIKYAALERTITLNDISDSAIASNKLGPDQFDMGLAHDESGLRFHLLFDTNVLDFSYVLDEANGVAEKLVPLSGEDGELLVGIRTGFVFKSEPELSRKRLIGVHSANISANNYYDGPFDQLPDGYKGKLNVKQAFEMIDADFAKTIDPFGNFKDRDGARVVIAPYLRYSDKSDFGAFTSCLAFGETSVDYRICMKDILAR